MFVASIKITIFLNDQPSTIKHKRSIIDSVKQKIFSKFRVSIAEVEDNDKLHLATLGIAIVSNNKKNLDQLINKIEEFMTKNKNISIVNKNVEYYNQ